MLLFCKISTGRHFENARSLTLGSGGTEGGGGGGGGGHRGGGGQEETAAAAAGGGGTLTHCYRLEERRRPGHHT